MNLVYGGGGSYTYKGEAWAVIFFCVLWNLSNSGEGEEMTEFTFFFFFFFWGGVEGGVIYWGGGEWEGFLGGKLLGG